MGEERATKTNTEGKKESHAVISSSISSGGGGGNGIGGLLVFGGALAVAGFIAVSSFATNRNKAKTKEPLNKPKPQPQQELSLDDIVKSQDHHDGVAVQSACRGTCDFNLNQTLILEEKTEPNLDTNGTEGVRPTGFHHQEIVLSDDSPPQSEISAKENGIEEECLVSLFDDPGSLAQKADQDDPRESLKPIETETHHHDDTDDDNGNLESGKEEDSSKGTEGTFLNSNEEPVWPAELIEEAEQDSKGEEGITDKSDSPSEEAQGAAKPDISVSADCCDSQVCSDTDVAYGSHHAGTNEAMSATPKATLNEKEATLNDKASFSSMLNDQPSASPSFQLRTWLMLCLMPMLLLASVLLLVLLTNGTHQSFYVLNDMK